MTIKPDIIKLLYRHISRPDMDRIRETAIVQMPELVSVSDEYLLSAIFAQVYRHDARLMVERFYELYPDEDFDSFRQERLLYLKLVTATKEKIRNSTRRGFKKSNGNFGIESWAIVTFLITVYK